MSQVQHYWLTPVLRLLLVTYTYACTISAGVVHVCTVTSMALDTCNACGKRVTTYHNASHFDLLAPHTGHELVMAIECT